MSTYGKTLVAVASLSILGFLGGCSTASRSDAPASAARASAWASDPIVEPETFAASLDRANPDRVILDCRKVEDFAPTNIKGSRRVDLAEWSKKSRSPGGLDDAAGWSDRIGALGISDTSVVYVYDAGGMTDAARVWFLLQRFGVRDIRVVNGGWKNLQPLLTEKHLQHGTSSAFAPTTFAARVGGSIGVTSREDLKDIAAKKSMAVLDVRTTDEYTGKSAKEGDRGGHVPTATNLPHRDMLDENGRLRPATDLKQMLGGKSLKQNDEVVIYCQSGGRASLAALAAVRAGYTNISNYYMSMGEWLEDETCPIQR